MSTPDEYAPRHRKAGRAKKLTRTLRGRRTRGGPAADCGCPPGFHEFGAHAPGAWPDADINPPSPGTYPVEDLASMSQGAASLLLHRAQTEADCGAESRRHMVIFREANGSATPQGPFDNGLAALTFAHDLLLGIRHEDPGAEFTLTVAPVFPQ